VNTTLPEAGRAGSLDHSVILAVHHGRARQPPPELPSPAAPRVVAVNTTTPGNEVYGAGTTVIVDVVFNVAVHVHCIAEAGVEAGAACPGIALRTSDSAGGGVVFGDAEWADWSVMSLARYCAGNGTATLSFRYDVKDGDCTAALDYADTRPAARTQRYSRALVLPCEAGSIASAMSCRRARGGAGLSAARIVRALDPLTELPPSPEVHAVTFLPVPGSAASLGRYNITIDSTPPVVVAVTTPARNAVYEPTELVTEAEYSTWHSSVAHWPSDDGLDDRFKSWMVKDRLAIDVRFSWPVAVAPLDLSKGCALELKMDVAVNRVLSAASWADSVAGSNGALRRVEAGRRAAAWTGEGNGTDTLRFRLPIFPGDYAPLLDYSDAPDALSVKCAVPVADDADRRAVSVFRLAERLVTPADLALPPPGPRTAVVAATSLVGSGHRVALQGDTCCRVTSLACAAAPETGLEGWDTFDDGAPRHRPSTAQGFFTGMPVVVRVTFASPVTVRAPTTVLDVGPRLHLRVATASFDNRTKVVTPRGNASETRWREGPHVPTVEALLTGGNGTDTLEFTYVVAPGDSAGYLDVANHSALQSSLEEIVVLASDGGPGIDPGGQVGPTFARLPAGFPADAFLARPVATRLPVWPALASLGRSCRARIDGSPPRVLAVRLAEPMDSFVPPGGVFTGGETVPVVVVFSAPVDLDGVANLALDVLSSGLAPGTAAFTAARHQGFTVSATAADLDEATHTRLIFKYVVEPGHSSPALNYTNRHALAGRIAARHAPDQAANLQLPGKAASLPSLGVAVVDTSLPIVTDVSLGWPTCSGVYGAGEEVLVAVSFSAPVVLVPRFGSWNITGFIGALNSSTHANATNATNVTALNGTAAAAGFGGGWARRHNGGFVPPYLTLEMDVSGTRGNANATMVASSFEAAAETGASRLVFSVTLMVGDGSSRLDYSSSDALRLNAFAWHVPVRLLRAPTNHAADTAHADDAARARDAAVPLLALGPEFRRWNSTLGVGVDLALPERGTAGGLGASSAVTVDPPLDSRPFIWLVAMDLAGADYSKQVPPAWLAPTAAEDSRTESVYGSPDAIEEDHTEVGVGDALHLRLRFTERVLVHGLPAFQLSTGDKAGNTTTATYIGGNGTDELLFEYKVVGGDADTCVLALEGALRCGCVAPACRIEGLERSRQRPRSVGRAARGDAGGHAPLAARLRLPLEWPSFTRHAALFLEEYRHTAPGPDADGQTASWRHNASTIVNVTTERANGTLSDASRLLPAFLDALPTSSFFSSGLAAPSANLFSRFTTVETRASAYTGEPTTYGQAEGCVRVQTKAVAVVRVTTDHADGTWGAGEHVVISVLFTGPVRLVGESTVALRFEVGDTVMDRTVQPPNATTVEGDDQGAIVRRIARAEYINGNNTARLRFRYVVQPGHASANLDVDASACRAVCIAAGVGVSSFPFEPYTFPAACNELLSEGANQSLFRNYSQRPVDLPSTFGEYKTFRAATALEVTGRLVRRSALALDDVDPSLPCPGTPGSLSHGHELVIDSRPPRVDFVVSLRMPDAYRAGETVDLQVVFDKPVTVAGPPGSLRLALNLRSKHTTTNATNATAGAHEGGGSGWVDGYAAFAVHDPGCSMRREGFSFEDRSICFTYVVKHGDVASPFLDYRDEAALELRNGSVFRTATEPLGPALTRLPRHDDFGDRGLGGFGGVEAFQRVAALQVKVSGLSHDDASDLQVAIEHNGRRATLMDHRLAKRGDLRLGPEPMAAFTDYRTPAQSPTPVPYTSAAGENGTTSTPSPRDPWNTLRHASGGGSTYYFGDTTGRNLAAEGRACQSSTRFGAFAQRANDGDANPYLVSGQSVTHTSSGVADPAPWWQLSLRRPSPVGTVRIWPRLPEVRVDEVQYVHVHAHTSLDNAGTFRLEMDRRTADGGVAVETSDRIAIDAVAMISDESLLPAPPAPPLFPTSSADRFAPPSDQRFCAPGVDCPGDSVQAKVEALLQRAFPLVSEGNLRVTVCRGRDHGSRAGQAASVAHEITHFTPDVDTAELPPTTADVSPAAHPSDRAARQKASLSDTPAAQLHWSARQGDFDRAWRITFVGGMGNVPELRWPGGAGADRDDATTDERQTHVGGLTALNVAVTTSTLRQGAHAPAPHGRDDRARSVGDESAVGERPGEAVTGPAWVMLFNTTEPPPRGLSLFEARRLAVWSTFLDASAFAPAAPTDFKHQDRGATVGGGPRGVAVVRVPGVWARHLRVQRGAQSDVVTASVLLRQALASRVAVGSLIPMNSVTDDPTGSAVTDGGSYIPIEEARARQYGGDAEFAGVFDNITVPPTTYTTADVLGFAPLALAEVEVFEEVHSPLHEYAGSSPLPPSVGSSPLAPAIEPLMATFGGEPTAGRWVLSVRDRVASTHPSLADDRGGARSGALAHNGWDRHGWGRRRRVHGVGSIGRWELKVTDILGFTHTFFMDTALTVTTLPKFGHLFLLGGGKSGLEDAADATAELLGGVEGEREWRWGCAGVDTTGMDGVDAADAYRHCAARFGVGGKRGGRRAGDGAVRVPLRGSASSSLVYVPRLDFTGADSFDFRVSAGAGLGGTTARASQPAAVTLRVRACRKRGGPYFPEAALGGLCGCASPLLFTEPSARAACFEALVGACVDPRSTFTADDPGSQAAANDTAPQSTVSFASSGDGRCDAVSGVCAPGLPDKVVADPRPSTSSWVRSREVVPSGLERMCRACEGSASFSRLNPQCWAEWLAAMHAYGLRVAVGGSAQCLADVKGRGSFDAARCEDDAFAMPMGHTPEPRGDGARAAGRP